MSLRGHSPKQSPTARGDRAIVWSRYALCGERSRLLDLRRFLSVTLLFFLSSCSPVATQVTPTRVVDVYATQATQPWLSELFDCASASSVIINMTDPESAEIILRIGEPRNLTTPAYQIDTEEILIVTHRESPVQNLTLDEARALFAGQGDPSVQVWVYSSGEDVQETFDQLVMAGRSVTAFAKLAASPQQMSDLLIAEKSAVGILPEHWKVGDSRIVFNAGTVPVLTVVKSEPQGAVQSLLACLQK
jgi:hypothetical protein